MTRRQPHNDGFATYEDWRRWREESRSSPNQAAEPTAPSADGEPSRADGGDDRDPLCELCGGTRWVEQWDEFLGGLVQGRCPACCDLSVRAERSRWEDDHGNKVGPG